MRLATGQLPRVKLLIPWLQCGACGGGVRQASQTQNMALGEAARGIRRAPTPATTTSKGSNKQAKDTARCCSLSNGSQSDRRSDRRRVCTLRRCHAAAT